MPIDALRGSSRGRRRALRHRIHRRRSDSRIVTLDRGDQRVGRNVRGRRHALRGRDRHGRAPILRCTPTLTVTFSAPKVGILLYPGCGSARAKSSSPTSGFRGRCWASRAISSSGSRATTRRCVPRRGLTITRTREVACLIVAGSGAFPGAAVLAAHGRPADGRGLRDAWRCPNRSRRSCRRSSRRRSWWGCRRTPRTRSPRRSPSEILDVATRVRCGGRRARV